MPRRRSGTRADTPYQSGPLIPSWRAPEVVHPEEPALLKVFLEAQNLVVAEPRGSEILHEYERTPEEQRDARRHDHVIGLTGFVEVHADPRQLGQADREVVVGAGVIGAPAALVERAAIEERAVEVGGLRPSGREAPEPAAADPDLLCVSEDRTGQRDAGEHDGRRLLQAAA